MKRLTDDSELVTGFICFKCLFGVCKVRFVFPGVVSCGVANPFDEVLGSTSCSSVFDDGFYFEFLFAFDKVRWGVSKRGSMCLIGAIRR